MPVFAELNGLSRAVTPGHCAVDHFILRAVGPITRNNEREGPTQLTTTLSTTIPSLQDPTITSQHPPPVTSSHSTTMASSPLLPRLPLSFPPSRIILAPLPVPSTLPCSPRKPPLSTPFNDEAKAALLSVLSLPWVSSLLSSPLPPFSDLQLSALWSACKGVLDLLLSDLTRIRQSGTPCDSFDELLSSVTGRHHRLPSVTGEGEATDCQGTSHIRSSSLPSLPVVPSPCRINLPPVTVRSPPPSLSVPSRPDPPPLPCTPAKVRRVRAHSEAGLVLDAAQGSTASLQAAVVALNTADPAVLDPPVFIAATDLLPLLAFASATALLSLVQSLTSEGKAGSPFPLSGLPSLLSLLQCRLIRLRLLSLLSFPRCRLFSNASRAVVIRSRHLEALQSLGVEEVEAEVARMDARGDRVESIDVLIGQLKHSIWAQAIPEEEEGWEDPILPALPPAPHPHLRTLTERRSFD